jgi:hypothetical protein
LQRNVQQRHIPHIDWDQLIAAQEGAPSAEAREKLIVDAFRASVKREGSFKYVPSLTVQKTLADRTLYHLVFGTRSSVGLEVFRSSQVKALGAQADVRSKAKDQNQVEKSGQGSLFGGADRLAGEFSTQVIEAGVRGGTRYAKQIIQSSPGGVKWKDLWPQVLDDFVVTTSTLGRAINELRKAGKISAPGWPSEHKLIPPDDQLLIRAPSRCCRRCSHHLVFCALPCAVSLIFLRRFDSVDIVFDMRSVAICSRIDAVRPSATSLIPSAAL